MPIDLKKYYPFTGRYFALDGLRLHYLDEGEGPVVVMVHGNPSWSFYYRNLVKTLSSKYRCIVPDHIGCGFSAKPGTIVTTTPSLTGSMTWSGYSTISRLRRTSPWWCMTGAG